MVVTSHWYYSSGDPIGIAAVVTPMVLWLCRPLVLVHILAAATTLVLGLCTPPPPQWYEYFSFNVATGIVAVTTPLILWLQ
jgi:hypothetical protein